VQNPQNDMDQLRQAFQVQAFIVLGENGKIKQSSAASGLGITDLAKQIQHAIQNRDEAFLNGDSYWVGIRRGMGTHKNEAFAAVFTTPAHITELNAKIAAERQYYNSLAQKRVAYRDNYVIILLLMTVLVLFAAVWVGLFWSRRITVPLEALSEA